MARNGKSDGRQQPARVCVAAGIPAMSGRRRAVANMRLNIVVEKVFWQIRDGGETGKHGREARGSQDIGALPRAL
jgi:hypothetical protein